MYRITIIFNTLKMFLKKNKKNDTMKKIIVISTSLRAILRVILQALCSAEALTLHAPLRATRNCRKHTS